MGGGKWEGPEREGGKERGGEGEGRGKERGEGRREGEEGIPEIWLLIMTSIHGHLQQDGTVL